VGSRGKKECRGPKPIKKQSLITKMCVRTLSFRTAKKERKGNIGEGTEGRRYELGATIIRKNPEEKGSPPMLKMSEKKTKRRKTTERGGSA